MRPGTNAAFPMLFALKKILSALLLPPVSSIVLALLGLWLARYHRRTGNTLVVLSLLSVLVLSWPPVSDALVRSLERYPAVTPRQLPEAKVQAIVVLGGLGRITGTVVAAVVVTVMMEALRFLDESINLGFIQIKGIPGMRMVIFSIILILVVVLRREGLLTRLKGREASYAEN